MEKPYLTLKAAFEHEIDPIKGSRFIALATPINSDADAQQFVEQVRNRFADARHCCWAYQLCHQQKTRFSDDGEPNGSAGKPILAPLVGRQLFDVLIVVVRYFGGVKLGVGGLVRAYSQAANQVLEKAQIIEIIPKKQLFIDYPYEQTAAVAAVLAKWQLTQMQLNYTDRVSAVLAVVPDALPELEQQLTDYTAGRIILKRS